jgi:hypothetical protein
MPRRLKTYVTSVGFFDLAVAAPSMKAALAAWGADSNLFHQGFAKQVEDSRVVEATMSKPGVVLKRPVGSSGVFKQSAHLPAILPGKRSGRDRRSSTAKKKHATGKSDAASRKAARAYERAEKKREARQRKEDAARERKLKRRERAVGRAQTALNAAEKDHRQKLEVLEEQRAAINKRVKVEEQRWEKQRSKLTAALRGARSA